MRVPQRQVPYVAEKNTTQSSHTLNREDHPIFHLEAINVVAALKTWAPQLKASLVHLHTDNATAAAIFQLNRGRDAHIQECIRELWLSCAQAYNSGSLTCDRRVP